MKSWQGFFENYLTYLNIPFEENSGYIITNSSNQDSSQKNRYAFCEANHKEGDIGFYPGTNFFYNILENSLEKGRYVTAYLNSKRFLTPEKPFTPFLYLYLTALSPAISAFRKNYSLLIDLSGDALYVNPNLKTFIPIDKGLSLKRSLSHKDAFTKALDYIKDDLSTQKKWLEQILQNQETFLRDLKKAGLSKEEEALRQDEAKARLSPRFEVKLKSLARIFLK